MRTQIVNAACFICLRKVGAPYLHSASSFNHAAGCSRRSTEHPAQLDGHPCQARDDEWFALCNDCKATRKHLLFRFEYGNAYPLSQDHPHTMDIPEWYKKMISERENEPEPNTITGS